MRRGRLLILFALIILFGAVAVFLFLRGVTQQATEAQGTPAVPSDMVEIVIAAQDIARGAEIPPDGVIAAPFPADSVVETMLTDIGQAVGRRARLDIARGIPITENMVTDAPGTLLGTGSIASIAIPPGMTAIAVPMSRLSGVAFALRDGDSVDVVVAMLLVDLDQEFQSQGPDNTMHFIDSGGSIITGTACAEITQDENGLTCTNPERPPVGRVVTDPETGIQLYAVPSENQRPRLVTQRLVRNATVLHVGTSPLSDEPAPVVVATPAVAEEAAGGQQAGAAATPEPEPDIITLIVSPQDALALNWAMKAKVDMTLTLRSPGDTTSIETTSVTLQYLIDNYGIAVPSKLPYGLQPRLDEIIPPVLGNDAFPAAP
ncbi:MAG: Flp pilus assembly protein CpaB [Chloroflexi bacterium RBG_19FT_COMBO_62_14]|nr:MAG: Flp pilus assembly protein CpaB [Chloroflexi bacterium RBG_19FT_COMBO_62_14]